MNKQDKELLMGRIVVIINGILGFVAGAALGIIFILMAAVFEYKPQTIATWYLYMIGPWLILGVIGFYLAVRDDWYIMTKWRW